MLFAHTILHGSHSLQSVNTLFFHKVNFIYIIIILKIYDVDIIKIIANGVFYSSLARCILPHQLTSMCQQIFQMQLVFTRDST